MSKININRCVRFWLLGSLLGSLAWGGMGCSSAVNQRDAYITAYHTGDIVRAESALSAIIREEIPPAKADSTSNDAAWLLLDRGTARFASGEVVLAIDDYRRAIDLMDFYSQDCAAETVGKLLLQDDLGAYAGEDFEQVLARVYLALALLHTGDMGNAYALLRQAEEWQQQKREEYRNSPVKRCYALVENAVAKYLFAVLLEKQGDASNAAILYGDTAALVDNAQLKREIGVCDAQILSPSGTASLNNRSCATILVLCHNGNAPHKVSVLSDASVASTVALEIFLGMQDIDPAWSSLAGIQAPALRYWNNSQPLSTIASLDGIQKPLLPLYCVGETAAAQLDQQMPLIVARGVARYLLRRGAVACANDQDPQMGALVDFAMFVANLHTKADTRSWTTLPETIDVARYDTCEGKHRLTIQAAYMSPMAYELQLSQGDLCVVSVFNIHPGVTTVQIPKRFLITKGEGE